ncbi:M3 family metallopeptidase, partial [Pseudopedobacter sp.]|uniref:M3 family metallopeptidase n=1 Tax=Pseudopedobacter sp. TaxID=1936787 RepID=UPI0033425A30
MRNKHIFPGLLLFCSMSTLNNASATAQSNPFFTEYNTPFEAPPFEAIKAEHYMPAFEEAMKQQKAKVAAIYKVRSVPTFQNTIVALEESGKLLEKVVTVFFNLTSANTNTELEKISSEIAPKLSQHNDDIFLNQELFKRVNQVHDNISKEKLTSEEARLLDKTYKAFVRSGASLDEKSKEQLRKINQELSSLTVKFGQNLLKEVNAYELVIDNKQDLAGLPEGLISNAAKTAKESNLKGKWKFTLHNPSVMPFLEYADNRKLRAQIYKAYTHKGDNNNEFDNNENVAKMVALRAERSKLLGYASYADFSLQETMAKTPISVFDLLNNLWSAAL